MILTYHEGSCVRISAGIRPSYSGLFQSSPKVSKPTNFGADAAFVSLNHADMNGVEEAGRGDKKPFAVMGPGEYEVKDVTASGFPSKSSYGEVKR